MASYYYHGLQGFPGAGVTQRGMEDATNNYAGLTIRHCYNRVPVSVELSNGNIALFFQSMPSSSDQSTDCIMRVISTDGGSSWGEPQLVYKLSDYINLGKWLNMGVVGPDGADRIFLIVYVGEDTDGANDGGVTVQQAFVMHNDDPELAYANWSAATDITDGIDGSGDIWNLGVCKLIQIQAGSQAGYLAYPIYTRPTPGDVGDLAIVYSDDDGETWQRGGQMTGDQGVHETTMCELRDSSGNYTGKLYWNARVQTGVSTAGRWHGIIEDVTAAIDAPAKMKDGSGTDIPHGRTMGSAWCSADGTLSVLMNSNASDFRGRAAIFQSTNALAGGLPTFTVSREVQINCGYCDLRETSPGNFLALLETTYHRSFADIGLPFEFIVPVRFNQDYVESTLADNPLVTDYHFNEATSGVAPLRGTCVIDHGPYHYHLPGEEATGSSWGDGFLSFDGVGVGIQLQSKMREFSTEQFGGPFDLRADNITIAMRVRVATDGPEADQTIADGTDDTTTNYGYTLKVNTSGELVMRSNHTATGGNSVDHTLSGLDLMDGVWRTLYYVRNQTHQQLHAVADDGTVTSSTAAADTRGVIINTLLMRLGSQSTGGEPGKFDISHMRVTRGKALSGAELISLVDAPKQTPAEFAGANRFVTPDLPSSFAANALVAVGCTWDGGYSVGWDKFGGWNKGRIPPIHGQGAGACRDLVGNKLFESIAYNSPSFWMEDDKIGFAIRQKGVWRHSSDSAAGSDGVAATDSYLDIVPNTRTAAVSFCCEILATTGAEQILATTQGSNHTYFFVRRNNTTGGLRVALVKGAGTPTIILDQAFSTAVLEIGKVYYVGIDFDAGNATGNGANKIVVYLGEYTAGKVVPSLTKYVSSGTMGSNGSDAGNGSLSIGASNTGTAVADWRFKNFIVFNTPLNAAGHDEWAELGVYDGVLLPSGTNRINLGIGIGL